MSPARNVAACRTLRFSKAPTTISAPLGPNTSTTSPGAAGPLRSQDPRTGAAHGSVWAAPPLGTNEHASTSRGIIGRHRLMGSSLHQDGGRAPSAQYPPHDGVHRDAA